jgi:hypothetical protein
MSLNTALDDTLIDQVGVRLYAAIGAVADELKATV